MRALATHHTTVQGYDIACAHISQYSVHTMVTLSSVQGNNCGTQWHSSRPLLGAKPVHADGHANHPDSPTQKDRQALQKNRILNMRIDEMLITMTALTIANMKSRIFRLGLNVVRHTVKMV